MSAALVDGMLVGLVVAGAAFILWRALRPAPRGAPVEADAVLKGALASGVKRAAAKRSRGRDPEDGET